MKTLEIKNLQAPLFEELSNSEIIGMVGGSSITKFEIVESVASLSVLEIVELTSQNEEKFGISASAIVKP